MTAFALELGERLCERCLEAGGYCAGCLRSLLPQIAVNRGWLKLIAAARDPKHLATRVSTDPAVLRAERREARKRAKKATARTTRMTKLISGQYHRAAPRRAALSPTP